jgi:hypothetical protein
LFFGARLRSGLLSEAKFWVYILDPQRLFRQ